MTQLTTTWGEHTQLSQTNSNKLDDKAPDKLVIMAQKGSRIQLPRLFKCTGDDNNAGGFR